MADNPDDTIPWYDRVPQPYGLLAHATFVNKAGQTVQKQIEDEQRAWNQKTTDERKDIWPSLLESNLYNERQLRLRSLKASNMGNNFAATLATILLYWLPTNSNVVRDNRFIRTVSSIDLIPTIALADPSKAYLLRTVNATDLTSALVPFVMPCRRLSFDKNRLLNSDTTDATRNANNMKAWEGLSEAWGLIHTGVIIEQTSVYKVQQSDAISTLVCCIPIAMAGYGFPEASKIIGQFPSSLVDTKPATEKKDGVTSLALNFKPIHLSGEAKYDERRARLAIDPWYSRFGTGKNEKLTREEEKIQSSFRMFYQMLSSIQTNTALTTNLKLSVLTLFKQKEDGWSNLQHALYLQPGKDRFEIEIALDLIGHATPNRVLANSYVNAGEAYKNDIGNIVSLDNFQYLIKRDKTIEPSKYVAEVNHWKKLLAQNLDDCLVIYLPQAPFQDQETLLTSIERSLWTDLKHLAESVATICSWLFLRHSENTGTRFASPASNWTPKFQTAIAHLFADLFSTDGRHNEAGSLGLSFNQVISWIAVTNVEDEQKLRQGYIDANRLSKGFFCSSTIDNPIRYSDQEYDPKDSPTRVSQCFVLGNLAAEMNKIDRSLKDFEWKLNNQGASPLINSIAEKDRIIGVAVLLNLTALERLSKQMDDILNTALTPQWQEIYLESQSFQRLAVWPGNNYALPPFLQYIPPSNNPLPRNGDLMDVVQPGRDVRSQPQIPPPQQLPFQRRQTTPSSSESTSGAARTTTTTTTTTTYSPPVGSQPQQAPSPLPQSQNPQPVAPPVSPVNPSLLAITQFMTTSHYRDYVQQVINLIDKNIAVEKTDLIFLRQQCLLKPEDLQ